VLNLTLQEITQEYQRLYSLETINWDHDILQQAQSGTFQFTFPWDGRLQDNAPPEPPPYPFDEMNASRARDGHSTVPASEKVPEMLSPTEPAPLEPQNHLTVPSRNPVHTRRRSEEAPIPVINPSMNNSSTGLQLTPLEHGLLNLNILSPIEEEANLHENARAKEFEAQIGNTEYGYNWFTEYVAQNMLGS
jgi:hypothetical protein